MPGLCGIFGLTASNAETGVSTMLGAMFQEPFYRSGTFADARLPVHAAWKVHRDTFADCLPLWNETRDVALLFTGECFGDEPQIKELRRQGHVFADNNAGYLVHLYEERGLSFLETLNGSFAGLLLDFRERKAVLFNDRFGLGRLYVHAADGGIYFASEAKSLLRLKPELRRMDFTSLGEWFACGCVLQDRTLFQGITLLPAGSAWVFSGSGEVTKRKYFDQSAWESQERLSENEYGGCLIETFPRILKRYLEAKTPVGMSLTGGLDGRLIMAWADQAPGQLPCYTFNGPLRDCADVKIARRLAQACGQPHCTLPIGGEFFAEFPKLAEQTIAASDGAMDVSGAAELFLNRAARKISPIRLTGNYGSEILRNNVAFRPRALASGLFTPAFAAHVTAAADTYREEFSRTRCRSFIAFKQVPWHHYARSAVERTQLNVRSPYLDNDLVALAFRAPATGENRPEPLAQVVSAGKANLWRIPTDRGVTYPAKPFNRLRRAAVEFMVKAEYAFDYGMPQWLCPLDRALPGLGERLFLGRQKFCHFRIWYRDALANYVREMLLDARTLNRPYLNAAAVKATVEGHLGGRQNFTVELHKLLSAELVWRQLIES